MRKLYLLLTFIALGTTTALAQWNTNATPVCIYSAAGQSDYYAVDPKVARTADKKTWIAWRTWGKKDINGRKIDAVRTYLQLLDIDGKPQFDEPIMVNDHISQSSWSEYALQAAADGSAIVTVADGRAEEANLPEGYSHSDGYSPAIYKIDQEGNFLWGLDGVEFRDYREAAYTNCFVVGEDTWFTFFNQYYGEVTESTDLTNFGIFIQRINDDGTTLWDKPRKVGDDFSFQPQIIASEGTDFLYFDETPLGSRVQRMNRDFEGVWSEAVLYDNNKYDGYEMNHYRIVSDGKGGAAVAFVWPMGQFSHNVRVQHINADGSLGFGLTGLDAANTVDNDYDYCGIAANPETEEILVDFESQLESSYDVMLQKFTYDGDYCFDELGVSIASKSRQEAFAFGRVGSGALKGGDWIVAYRDVQAYGANTSFVIRRYDKDNNRVWTKTIGRNLDPSRITFIVEPEASYLFYREDSSSKNPGITIFRISNDGNYTVDYSDGIDDVKTQPTAVNAYYDLNGRKLAQPAKGLNIVRHTDGMVEKVIR